MASGKGSSDVVSTTDQDDRSTVLDALEDFTFGLVALTSQAITESTARGELTVQQWRILVVLGQHESGMRVSHLARRIAASGPSTSRLVKRLASRGLIANGPDPEDGRAIRVSLSAGGAALRSRIVARQRALIRETVGANTARRRQSPELARLAAAVRSAS